jgi:hypothetical protein
VSIDVPGTDEPLYVADVHLNSRKKAGVSQARSFEAYKRQVELVSRVVHEAIPSSAAFIFAGDFNVRDSRDRRDYLFGSDLRLGAGNHGLRSLSSRMPLSGGAKQAIRHGSDYQFYFSGGDRTVEPVGFDVPFGDRNAREILSDHIEYSVKYRTLDRTVEMPGTRTAGRLLLASR